MFGSKDPTCPFFAFVSLVDILDVASPDGIVVSRYGICQTFLLLSALQVHELVCFTC